MIDQGHAARDQIGPVLGRPQKPHRPHGVGQRRDPGLAAAGDRVIGGARQAERVEISLHRLGRARRVGEEDDLPPLALPIEQPFRNPRQDSVAVVDHAPDVAQDRPIFRVERVERAHAAAGAGSVASAGSPADMTCAATRSPTTLSVVRHISRKRSTPSTSAIASGWIPTIARISAMTGSDPAGMPAVPIPPRMQTSITISCWPRVRSMPKNWARKITVTPSNIAVPFWFAVAPMVSTKRDTRRGSFSRSSATLSEVGSVALDEAVEKAIRLASCVSRKKAIGFFLPKVASSAG